MFTSIKTVGVKILVFYFVFSSVFCIIIKSRQFRTGPQKDSHLQGREPIPYRDYFERKMVDPDESAPK